MICFTAKELAISPEVSAEDGQAPCSRSFVLRGDSAVFNPRKGGSRETKPCKLVFLRWGWLKETVCEKNTFLAIKENGVWWIEQWMQLC